MATVKAWIMGLVAGAMMLFGVLAYRGGRKDERQEAQIDDYENATDIRRRVSVNLDDELRKYDDSGWRD